MCEIAKDLDINIFGIEKQHVGFLIFNLIIVGSLPFTIHLNTMYLMVKA